LHSRTPATEHSTPYPTVSLQQHILVLPALSYTPGFWNLLFIFWRTPKEKVQLWAHQVRLVCPPSFNNSRTGEQISIKFGIVSLIKIGGHISILACQKFGQYRKMPDRLFIGENMFYRDYRSRIFRTTHRTKNVPEKNFYRRKQCSGQTDSQPDRQTDRQPASQPARQTDRQTDIQFITTKTKRFREDYLSKQNIPDYYRTKNVSDRLCIGAANTAHVK